MTSYRVQMNYQNNQKHFIKQPKKLIRGAAQSNNKVSNRSPLVSQWFLAWNDFILVQKAGLDRHFPRHCLH